MLFLLTQEIKNPTDDELDFLIESENLKQEYAEQLAITQGIYQEVSRLDEVIEEGKQYKRPSLIKYSILYTLALVTDAVDLLEITGVGYFIAKAFKLFCNGTIILIFWLTNTRQKNAHKYMDHVEDLVSEVQANLAHYTRLTLRTARLGRIAGKLTARYLPKVGTRISKISGKVPRLLVKVRRMARKNPLTKFIFASLVDLAPLVDLLPWTTLGVYLSWRDEKSSYHQARLAAEDIETQINSENE